MSKFNAFISYSHSADDMLSSRLQAALHRFARPWWKLRAVRVFRDKTNLAVSPELWPDIVAALDNAEYFILMASPAAAQSIWVEREVNHWRTNNPDGRILIVLTEGTLHWSNEDSCFDWSVTTAVPHCLQGVFEHEPLFVDFRWAKQTSDLSSRNPRFAAAVAQIAAKLHGRDLDEMIGEDVKIYRRNRALAWSAGSALVCLALVAASAAYLAVQQRDAAESARQVAEENFSSALSVVDTISSRFILDTMHTRGFPGQEVIKFFHTLQARLADLDPEFRNVDVQILRFKTIDGLNRQGDYIGGEGPDAVIECEKSARTVLQEAPWRLIEINAPSCYLGLISAMKLAKNDMLQDRYSKVCDLDISRILIDAVDAISITWAQENTELTKSQAAKLVKELDGSSDLDFFSEMFSCDGWRTAVGALDLSKLDPILE